MKVGAFILATRAISAEFAQRIFLPVIAIAGGALVLLIGVSVWLVTMSEWWWFLLGPVLFITLVFIFASVIAGIIIRSLDPGQSKEQRQHVRRFVDALQYAADTAQTPKFILLFRLMLDMLSPSKKGIVSELTQHAGSLKKDLQAIITSFS